MGTGGSYRTAPLWGLGRAGRVRSGQDGGHTLLHDGRATSIEAAILAHDGEAEASRARFAQASRLQRQDLLDWLGGL